MRFYSILISDLSGKTIMSFSSHNGEKVIPGALNIEFDLPINATEIPSGDGFLKIWGVGLEIINNAASLNGMNITILAGMKKGLPLATQQASAIPIRNGIIFQGSIYQSFGNWQGIEQSLDLILSTQLTQQPTDTVKKGNPIVFNCPAGKSFQAAIAEAMAAAKIISKVNVDSAIVAADPKHFYADSIRYFAKKIKDLSVEIKNDPKYLGITTFKTDAGYDFSDNTKKSDSKAINFNDLIGQPTWLDLLTVQLKVVLRSDIGIADTVTMPQTRQLNKSTVIGTVKDKIAFSGNGWVQSVRHIGNFRQQDANSWVTVINSILNPT